MVWDLFVLPTYAELLKYSWMYLPVLKTAWQSNKKCGCSVLLLYDVWHNCILVRFLFSFLKLKEQYYQFLSGSLVEVFAVIWLVISHEVETGPADLPIPASQIRALILQAVQNGRFASRVGLIVFAKGRAENFSRNWFALSAGGKRNSCSSSDVSSSFRSSFEEEVSKTWC